ncbi:MAG: ribosome biogenesis GTPase Der [Gammaproteobacteria bacterium]|nr:ribosome biogenesis GTPase Der [Gammaproteobacteria bacterium]
MLPVIALVGRPNVGKSTLFNALTRSRDALVADLPGLTRDRLYGVGRVGPRPYVVVDTGGLTAETQGVAALMAGQALRAVQEADAVLFLADARAGLTAADGEIAARLRRYGKPLHVVVNKAEGLDGAIACAEFHALGAGETSAISAVHGQGIERLMEIVLASLPPADVTSDVDHEDAGIKIAVVGRPNVGKSTLVNRLLGEERVLVFDQPGTTRDSIRVPFERGGTRYTLIDTAGVRRRSRVQEAVEKFSVVKTLQAVEEANVVIMVLDARQGIAEQDASLLGHVLDSGRALVVAVNKWDGLSETQRAEIRRQLDVTLTFLDFAPIHYISALHGRGVPSLLVSVQRAYRAARKPLATPLLTRILEDAVNAHQPPLVHGRRIKLRYAHQGGQNPPLIVVHGNQTEHVPASYRRYLANAFRQALKLTGTPVRVEFKSGENPFRGRKNELTPRQREKRKRLLRHARRQH